jgi:phosphatidylserine/phosphatidylglycerophosphate/cardiolipin synthase-like enzyme
MKVKLLHDAGFDIKIHSKDRIMHHKFAIFDNNKAFEGSFNWIYSAANKNAEDCNIFDRESDIKILKRIFKKLWKINTKNISECYFGNMRLEKEGRNSCAIKTKK